MTLFFRANRAVLADVLAISALILLHPMLWMLDQSISAFSPDAAAYMGMARDALPDSRLYLESWGQPNAHLILPPLYPLMIFLGLQFSPELLIVAETMASLSLLLVTIPLYFMVRTQTSPLLAFITCVVIFINFYTVVMGLTPLSEATYLLMSAFTLVCFYQLLKSKMLVWAALTGIFCGLVFLSRQIGLIHLLFCLFYLTLVALAEHRQHWKAHAGTAATILAGFLLVVTPWTISLYLQTSQGPLAQHFSTATPQPAHVDGETTKRLAIIDSLPTQTYQQLLVKRRQLLQLLPDGSDFISSALPALNSTKAAEQSGIISLINLSPTQIASQLAENISHLNTTAGGMATTLFFALCIFQYWAKSNRRQWQTASMLPLFCLCYLLAVSLITGKVERYLLVIQPFLICFIAIAAYALGGAPEKSSNRLASHISGLIAVLVCLIGYPLDARSINSQPKTRLEEIPITRYQSIIPAGDPVMAISPLYSVLAGGSYRVLPNDNLERTAQYAKKTKAPWILLTRSPSDRELIKLYNHAHWYRWPYSRINTSDLISVCCQLEGGRFALGRLNELSTEN